MNRVSCELLTIHTKPWRLWSLPRCHHSSPMDARYCALGTDTVSDYALTHRLTGEHREWGKKMRYRRVSTYDQNQERQHEGVQVDRIVNAELFRHRQIIEFVNDQDVDSSPAKPGRPRFFQITLFIFDFAWRFHPGQHGKCLPVAA